MGGLTIITYRDVTDCSYLAAVHACPSHGWARQKHADRDNFHVCKAGREQWHGWRSSQLKRESDMVIAVFC